MMIGEKVDFRRLWDWVQRSGEKLLASWEKKKRAIFEDGELSPKRADAPEIVSTSVDGTYIRTRVRPVEVWRKRTSSDEPVHSFASLLADLKTLAVNNIQPTDPQIPSFDVITTPTPVQRRAFELLGVSQSLGLS